MTKEMDLDGKMDWFFNVLLQSWEQSPIPATPQGRVSNGRFESRTGDLPKRPKGPDELQGQLLKKFLQPLVHLPFGSRGRATMGAVLVPSPQFQHSNRFLCLIKASILLCDVVERPAP